MGSEIRLNFRHIPGDAIPNSPDEKKQWFVEEWAALDKRLSDWEH